MSERSNTTSKDSSVSIPQSSSNDESKRNKRKQKWFSLPRSSKSVNKPSELSSVEEENRDGKKEKKSAKEKLNRVFSWRSWRSKRKDENKIKISSEGNVSGQRKLSGQEKQLPNAISDSHQEAPQHQVGYIK